MTERPLFNKENENVYPINEVDGIRMLVHCAVHQQAFPTEDQEETERMRYVRRDIGELCHSFKIRLVTTSYCEDCYEEIIKEIT